MYDRKNVLFLVLLLIIPISIGLVSAYSLSGVVTSNGGGGLEGVLVSDGGTNQANTDSGGYYFIDLLGSGTYTFTYTKSGYGQDIKEVTINDANITNFNVIIYENIPETTITSNPTNPSSDTSPTFEFTSTKSGTFKCQLDGGGYLVCSTPQTYAGPLSSGSHTFEVQAIDTLLNPDPTPASYTWTIDITAPTISITSPTNDQVFTSSPITVSGTASDNIGLSTVEVKVGSGTWQLLSVPTPWSAQVTLSEGSNTISVRANDTSGNSKEASINVILDSISSEPVSNPQTITGNFYINNTWTNPTNPDFHYVWFRDINGNTLENVTSPINYLNKTYSPHYTQSISAQTVDDLGNVNPTRVWFNATIPNNPPVLDYIDNKEIYQGQQLTFVISATDLDSDTIAYGTNAIRGELVPGTGSYSWTTVDGDAGVYTWEFNASDGNGGIDSETITITVKNPFEFSIKFVEPSIIKGNETWIDAHAGHPGKYIGIDGTFKNIGNDTLNLSVTENFNGESKDWLGLRSILPNETLSYGQLFGKPTFEINSSGINYDLNIFNFTFEINVLGLNTSLSYDHTTTIPLTIYPIFRMKQANGGIVLLADNSPGTKITYTLEANSTVNLTDVSIYDAFYPENQGGPYFNISNLEAGKPQSMTYTYQATTDDLSSLRCEESKFGDYPCIINLATMTGKINGSAFTDTDYVELFVCKLNDANCLKGQITYRVPNRGSSINTNLRTSSTSSSSSSSGGGGLPPSEDFNNIERREVREMSVQAKSVAAYVFKSADPVMAVSFESSVSENGVPVAVEVLRNMSKKASENAPGQLYKYFNIFVGTSGFSNKVSKGVVVFRVNNSWLEENRIDPGNVRLYKWDGIAWIEKNTQIADTKTNQTYYASMAGNFSSFAIAGIRSEKNSISGQFFDLSNVSNGSNDNPTNVENDSVKPPQNFNIILTIIPIIGLLGMIYYLRIRRKSNIK